MPALRVPMLLLLVTAPSGCEGRVIGNLGSLLRVDAEPPGANCAHGGTAVHTGLDVDKDGEIDDDEIDASEYICSPAPVVALLRVGDEPPGDNCANGGSAIHTGLDDDADGELDDTEIDDTAYVCNAVPDILFGTFTVRSQADLDFLAQFRELSGGMQIESPDLESVDLPLLTRLGGGLSVRYNAALRGLDGLTALEELGGNLLIESNPALENLDGLAGLRRVNGGLYVQSNRVLEPIAGLAGVDAANDVSIFANPQLSSLIGLDGLRYSGGIYIQDSPSLQDFRGLEQLRDIGGGFNLQRLIGLQSLDGLEGLLSVGRDVHLSGNPLLANLDGLGSLQTVGGLLQVLDNDNLTSFGLTSLDSLGGAFYVVGNDVLPTCAATVIRDQLAGAGYSGEVTISGNDDTGLCP